jgi:hypothetical protein
MKKILILAVMSAALTSCTVEDILNYLNGKPNDLSESDKQKIEEQKNSTTAEAQTSNTLTIEQLELELEKDRGVVPPKH